MRLERGKRFLLARPGLGVPEGRLGVARKLFGTCARCKPAMLSFGFLPICAFSVAFCCLQGQGFLERIQAPCRGLAARSTPETSNGWQACQQFWKRRGSFVPGVYENGACFRVFSFPVIKGRWFMATSSAAA